jgi:hypothetical protein
MWKVNFFDDPGAPQRYDEMNKVGVVAAIEHKEWYRQSSLIHQDEDGDDSC